MKAWIIAAGMYNLAFAVFHICFWHLFRWRTELAQLGVVNRGIMQILNLCLIYTFAAVGGALLAWPSLIASSPLGHALLLGMTGFWILRAACQPLFYSLRPMPSALLMAVFLGGVAIHGEAAWLAVSRNA
jgi:hypothetical protein